ncbi:MAG: hypothetical protein HYY44_00645 [Deltaproteobacteria bacterium]|nr:hypothetical protein [Deltaproteobacteria bacterium]
MRNRVLKFVVLFCSVLSLLAIDGCVSGGRHWGQNLDPDSKWWKKEGESWDRKNKIFMVIGASNSEWTDPDDLRKSSDLNARAEATSFMQSLVENYTEEVRGKGYALVESRVKATAKEALLGSVIVSRHFEKKAKKYHSLLQIDLRYFFDQIYDDYSNLKNLKDLEDPVVEKTVREGR